MDLAVKIQLSFPVFVRNPPLLTLIVVIPPMTNPVSDDFPLDDCAYVPPLISHCIFTIDALRSHDPSSATEILQKRCLLCPLQPIGENSDIFDFIVVGEFVETRPTNYHIFRVSPLTIKVLNIDLKNNKHS
ncbi:hypothetical protein RB195_018724 [Necator americanus]|uniref:Uncharacterized protein n=1 Tax=Necator americanus TaxID=51031 RepID=A0ABR1CCW0_NECAM